MSDDASSFPFRLIVGTKKKPEKRAGEEVREGDVKGRKMGRTFPIVTNPFSLSLLLHFVFSFVQLNDVKSLGRDIAENSIPPACHCTLSSGKKQPQVAATFSTL